VLSSVSSPSMAPSLFVPRWALSAPSAAELDGFNTLFFSPSLIEISFFS